MDDQNTLFPKLYLHQLLNKMKRIHTQTKTTDKNRLLSFDLVLGQTFTGRVYAISMRASKIKMKVGGNLKET